MIINSPTVQSPKAYDLTNLSGPQLAARMAASASAAQRLNLIAAFQDVGYRYKIHPAETAIGLVDANLNFGFDVGDIERYGTNTTPLTTSMANALQLAVNVAKRTGGTIYVGPGPYLIDAPIDGTFPAGAISAITKAAQAVVTFATVSAANPFYVGQLADIAGVVGMTQINNTRSAVTAIGGISGAWTVTLAIDSTAFSTYTSGGVVNGQSCSYAIIGRGRYKAATNNTGQAATPSLFFKHTGHCFDTTGSLGVHLENLSIATDSVTYPKTLVVLARNLSGNSRSDRILNCYALGKFSQTALYNYAAEDGTYLGNQIYNLATDAGTSVFDITGSNARALSSTFTTIATGTQSCVDHKIISGEYANFAGGATSDVFRLDGARSVKIYGPWLDSSKQDGSAAGRALIYIDGSVQPCSALVLHGIDGEAAVNSANYGILVSSHAQTHGPWLVQGCLFPNSTSMLGGGGGLASISNLTWVSSTNSSTGGNINFAGAFIGLQADASCSTVVANSLDNFSGTWNVDQTIQKSGQARLNLRDFSQASGSQWYTVRAAGGAMVLSAGDDSGNITTNFLQCLHGGSTQMLGKLFPVKDDSTAQVTCGLYAGAGVPSNANGNNGDFYLRSDLPGTANSRLYVKSAGAWVGIV